MHPSRIPCASYPDTWYARTCTDTIQRPQLDVSVEADFCVIGAGLAGLSTALELVRAGATVTVVEAGRIAWGASGRNGGFVAPGFATDVEQFVDRIGLDCVKRLYRYSTLGADQLRENIQRLSPHSLMGESKYALSRYPDTKGMKDYAATLKEMHGEPAEYRSRREIQQVFKTERYHDGVFKPYGFHIHPLNYALALAAEIERQGGAIYENSAAELITEDDVTAQVDTTRGSVRCQKVIVCTSGYDNGFYRPISRSVLPVATHVVVTEPLSDTLTALIGTKACIADTGNACDYYRLIDNNRLLWGGKITTMKVPPGSLNRQMQRAMVDVYPALSEVKIDYSWSGLMGYCRHKMPVIRKQSPQVWVATAFGGHGLNTATMAGILVSSALVSGDQRWRDFGHFGLTWNGGWVGQAAVQLSYWWMQAKDAWKETPSEGYLRPVRAWQTKT